MALEAGNDMLAICAGSNRYFRQRGSFRRSGLRRIGIDAVDRARETRATLKSELKQPLELDPDRISSLSQQVVELNDKLS